MNALNPAIQPHYRPDVDGLRAIAVLSVVGFHAFPKLFKGGYIGVDIFFVISGFLITGLLLQSLESQHFSLSQFYLKRVKRIFPALALVLLFSVVCGFFVLFPNEYSQLGKHIAGGASFIANFLLLQEGGYFDSAAETKPLLHLWSLGIEEQFYILWPLLIWAAWRKKKVLILLILGIALSSFFLNVKGIHNYPIRVFYSPHTRFWELLCGSLIAWCIRYYKIPATFLLSYCSALGLLTIGFCIYRLPAVEFPGIWALLPTLGAALIIIGGREAWINRVVLAHPLLVWFGLISFPLYLWHWPLLSFTHIILDRKPQTLFRIILVLLAVFLAWFTYCCIEKPIRFGNAFNKTKAFGLILIMSFMGAMGFYIYQQQGLLSRYHGNVQINQLVELIDNPFPRLKDFDCKLLLPTLGSFNFDGGCRLSKNAPPDIAFIGDSHTAHYYNAVWANFPSQSVLMIVQTSCLPFSTNEFMKGDCKNKFEAVLNFLESNPTIKTVYLSGYWAYLMSGGFEKTGLHWRNAKRPTDSGKKSFIENGRYFMTKVLNSHKEIIFLKDIPDLNFNIKSCFKLRPFQSNTQVRQNCWLQANEYYQRVASYDQVLEELLVDLPIKVYNPRPVFCQNNLCLARDQRFPYYYNGDHLNHYGAQIVISDMKRYLNS